jgi:hypothetical protein
VFTYANKPTQLEHLDPKMTKRLSVVLGKAGNQAKQEAPKPLVEVKKLAPAPVVAAPIEKKPVAKVANKDGDKVVIKDDPDPAPKFEKPPVPKATSGEGTLMISSKPPCEIVIDGKPTGLTTPQRSIPLAAGSHRITLINSDSDTRRTVTVQIAPNATEKVIEDLMK